MFAEEGSTVKIGALLLQDGNLLCFDGSKSNLFLVSGFEKCSFSQRVMGKKVVTTPAVGTIDNQIAFENALLEMDDPYAAKGTSSLSKFYDGLLKAGEILGIDYIKVPFSNPDLNLLTAGVKNSLEAEIAFSEMTDLGQLFFSLTNKLDLDGNPILLSDKTILYLTNSLKDIKDETYIKKDLLDKTLKEIFSQNKYLISNNIINELSDISKLDLIATTLGINFETSEKNDIAKAIHEINKKIGPFLFKMILEDNIIWDSKGNWFLKGVYYESREQTIDLLCGDSIVLNGKSYHIDNGLTLYQGLFTQLIKDLTEGRSSFYLDFSRNHFEKVQNALDELIFHSAKRAIYKNHDRVLGFNDIKVRDHSAQAKEIIGEGAIRNVYMDLCSLLTSFPTQLDAGQEVLKVSFYNWIKNRIGQAQTGTITEDFTYNFEDCLYSYGSHSEKYIFKIVFAKADINEFIAKNGFFRQHDSSLFAPAFQSETENAPHISIHSFSALNNYQDFTSDLFESLQSAPCEKLYFIFRGRYGKPLKGARTSYYNLKPFLNAKIGYELDLKDNSDSQINHINLMRMYAGLLAGYRIYVSKSPSDFNFPKGVGLEARNLLAILTKTGCLTFNKRNSDTPTNEITQFEKILNIFIQEAFDDSGPLRILMKNHKHSLIPYSEPGTFAELLLSELSYTALKK
ncbi:MAG: hypothetical protein GF383_12005, partial [Candidatus Lokiarchaeota archaeon]|nr:hypothetical protein [Candidatus Lokiarchaeota archaeon]MBD3341609.1 hypothetical protein [Candidatus Lokiarchaeota archaeon]